MDHKTFKKDCETFKKELKDKVTCYYDANYKEQRKIKNARFDYKPWCIVKCESADDVSKAMKLCRQEKRSIRIRSGGHHHEGMCSADGVVIIDLSEMNDNGDITVDDNGMAWIKPGNQLQDIYKTLEKQGYTLPGGGCGTVNVGGLVQGGGWGMLARDSGLTCDSLQAVELVKADKGEIITAYEEDNKYKDLLWAIKGGGGGNFGVITKYQFKLKRVGNILDQQNETNAERKPYACIYKFWYASDISSEKELFKELLACYLDGLKGLDHRVTSFARVSTYDDNEYDQNNQPVNHGKRYNFSMTFQCLGHEESQCKELLSSLKAELFSIIQKNGGQERNFKEANPKCKLTVNQAYALLNGIAPSNWQNDLSLSPLMFSLQPLVFDKSFNEEDLSHEENLQMASFGTCVVDSFPHKVSSAFPKGNIDEIASSIIEFIFQHEDFSNAATYLSIHSLGGKIKDKDLKSKSSFYYRDKEFLFQFQAWWKNVADPEAYKYIDWVSNFRKHLDKDGCIEGAFINFPDRNLVVPPERETPESEAERLELLEYYYGGNLNRLREIKDQYDPDNFFSFGMSIPPKIG